MSDADTLQALINGALFQAMADRICEHVDELTELDQAIGDGDHGANMKRGFEAIEADLDTIALKPLPDAFRAAGTTLVMKVGGASGPLYGTLFMALGKALPAHPGRNDWLSAFGAAIDAVKARGKSETGQKTMLDVLVPVHDALAGGASIAEIRQAAADAAAATIPMQATKGRASFLGERSIGHMDPGARSSQLLIETACDLFGDPR